MNVEQQVKKLSTEGKKKLVRQIYGNDVHKFFKALVITLDEHDKTGQPFKKIPYDWEYVPNIINHIHNNDWSYIWKSRQIMATWIIVAYCLWIVLFHQGKKVAVQSKKGDDANELIKRMKIIYDKLPWWKPEAEFTYCHIKVPENTSEVYGVPQGEEQLRQYTFSVIFSDEFGFQERLKETFGAVKPTVDGGGKFIACTTPPREQNFAYDCLHNPIFKVLEVHYSQRPDRDAEWKARAKAGMPQADWDREYELQITQSGVSRIISDFSIKDHVNPNLIYNQSVLLLRGWDFGYHRPHVSFAQIDLNDRVVVLDSILGKDIIIDKFADRIVSYTNLNFPKAMIRDYCDMAGTQQNDKSEKTSVQILRSKGIFPVYRRNKNKEDPANILRRKIMHLIGGKPSFQVHPKCKYIINGLVFGLVYGKDGKRWIGDGTNEDGEPEKDYYMHGIDSLLYILLNIYTIGGLHQTHQQKMSAIVKKR